MASQDMAMENGEDFSQDVSTDQNIENSHNGGGDAPHADSGSAEMPGKDDDRKLFVGGLSWETTEKELRDYFGTFGEIDSINVKTDSMTGRSRGFAFIVFKEAESINKVSEAGEHTINGKKVDPKKAKARHGKIFVGGVPPELTQADIKEYFEQFGSIIDIETPFDKTKNQRKNFCFVTFESEQVVQDLLQKPKQTIKEKEVDVKRAAPKPDQLMGRGGRGMRGGPRGRGGHGGYGNWDQYGYGYQGYGYDGYGPGYDYYGSGYGNYGGYDYSGYGGNYDQGYGYEGGYGGGRNPSRGKGGSGFQGKARGGGKGNTQRHQPY